MISNVNYFVCTETPFCELLRAGVLGCLLLLCMSFEGH